MFNNTTNDGITHNHHTTNVAMHDGATCNSIAIGDIINNGNSTCGSSITDSSTHGSSTSGSFTHCVENPYFNNQKGYANRLDAERANTASWKVIALFSNFITLVAIIGCIYVANLPSMVPFIFKEDGSGGLTAMGVANQEMHINNQIVANQLAAFLIGLREVPTSVDIKKRYVTRVQMMSTPALFHNVLAKALKESYLKAGTGEVLITIKSIIPLSKNTWEMDWTEKNTSGASLGDYKATIAIELSKEFKNSSALMYNPIGLVITDININKGIGS